MLGNECPHRHSKGDKAVVCKHWLRALCKKDDHCEFLHEFRMDKMPECHFFANFGTTSIFPSFFIIIGWRIFWEIYQVSSPTIDATTENNRGVDVWFVSLYVNLTSSHSKSIKSASRISCLHAPSSIENNKGLTLSQNHPPPYKNHSHTIQQH